MLCVSTGAGCGRRFLLRRRGFARAAGFARGTQLPAARRRAIASMSARSAAASAVSSPAAPAQRLRRHRRFGGDGRLRAGAALASALRAAASISATDILLLSAIVRLGVGQYEVRSDSTADASRESRTRCRDS